MTSPITHAHQLVGWTPIALDLAAAEPWVEWTDLDATAFDDPFFAQTIRTHVARPSARRARSGVDALAVVGARCDAVGPSGFVLHGSRCGSTAFANALAAMRGAVVVREPNTVNRALLHGDAERCPERLAGLVHALLQRRSPSQRHGFVKLSSYAVLFAATLRRVFPTVPCVFVYRDPLEVAVSLLARPPGWASLLRGGALGISVDRLPAAADGPEELVAFAIGSLYRAALACRSLELVSYPELPGACSEIIARSFGVVLDAEEIDAIASSLGTDAKDAGGRRAFAPDGTRKREQASAVLRAAIDRHAVEPWLGLEARRLYRAALAVQGTQQ